MTHKTQPHKHYSVLFSELLGAFHFKWVQSWKLLSLLLINHSHQLTKTQTVLQKQHSPSTEDTCCVGPLQSHGRQMTTQTLAFICCGCEGNSIFMDLISEYCYYGESVWGENAAIVDRPKKLSLLRKHHILCVCVYQRLILFSLLATFPLVFLLIGLVFTLTLHQLIKVNTGFGTLSVSMCVCSLNDVFDHSRASICRCTPPPPSEPHANCLSRVVSTRQYFFTLAKTYQASDVPCRSRHLTGQKHTQICWHKVKLDYFVFDSNIL